MMEPSKKKSNSSKFKIAAFDMFGAPVSFNIRGDDSYKTVLGCFWSLLVLTILGVSFYWYFAIFLDKTNVEVTSKTIIKETYPKLDFKEKGYFFSISANRENKVVPMKKVNDLLDFEVLQMEINSETDDSGEVTNVEVSTPRIINFGNCGEGGRNETKIDGKELEGKKKLATSAKSFCTLDNDDGEDVMYIQGNEDSEKFAFIKIRILVCDSSNPDCILYYANPVLSPKEKYKRYGMEKAVEIHGMTTEFTSPTGTCLSPLATKTACETAYNKLKNSFISNFKSVYFTFNYVEGAVRAENYTDVFAYTIKSGMRISPAAETQKIVNIYFKEVLVETDVGPLLEKFEKNSTIAFDSVFVDTLDRGSDATIKEKRPDGTTTTKTAPLIEIYLYSSNNQLVYTRKYSKIVDVFADVGGIAEVVGFFVVFFYAWYSGIRLEQKLLNYGVLNKSDLEEKEVLINGGLGQISEKWERSRYFSFCELIRFGLIEKGLFCCGKRSKKFELYLKCKETLETRTDIINVMKTVAEVDTIKEACFDDYQNRLTPYLVNQKDDDDSNLRQMSITDAIQEIKAHREIKNRPEIKNILDDYLFKYLPREILNDEMQKLEIQDRRKRGRKVGPFGRNSKKKSSNINSISRKLKQKRTMMMHDKISSHDQDDSIENVKI